MKMNREMRRGKWPFKSEVLKDIVRATDAAERVSDEERIRITKELDHVAAKQLFPMMSDEAILPMLHRVRYETTAIEDELRHESRKWLETQGFSRMRGMPWPPMGVLPSGTDDFAS